MRDLALERGPESWGIRHLLERNRRNGRRADSGLRCPVCRAEYDRGWYPRTRYSSPGQSPLGREMYVVTCSSYYCRSRAPSFAFWPVDQTVFGVPHGNCFDACVAMLFELEIKDVPHFNGSTGEGDWWSALIEFARERGYRPVFQRGGTPPRGFAILGGQSPAHAPKMHAVFGFNGRIVWDPKWTRLGLLTIEDYITLERIN